jgi:hypothetical protein
VLAFPSNKVARLRRATLKHAGGERRAPSDCRGPLTARRQTR